MRPDIQSAVVMAIATVSSLSAAFWLTHQQPRTAEAAVMHPAVHASASSHAASGAAQIARGPDGHYWAEADIDGRAVRVLVDTGATVVALTRTDAQRLGLRLVPADFVHTVETASGPVKTASVELKHVAVAGARVSRVRAVVVEQGLPHSLLGMSYLGRLSAFEARPSGLTLRP